MSHITIVLVCQKCSLPNPDHTIRLTCTEPDDTIFIADYKFCRACFEDAKSWFVNFLSERD